MLLNLLALPFLAPSLVALSSSSPPDLAAFPKYNIVLTREVVSNETARALLARSASDRQSGAYRADGLADSVDNDGRQTEQGGGNKEESDETFELMRTRNGQAFLCSIPKRQSRQIGSASNKPEDESVLQAEPKSSEVRQAELKRRQTEMKAGLERGLKLLEPLKGFCLYQRLGWFTYAFCHGSEVRQFHEIRVHGQLAPAEDPNTEAYTLGIYPNPENSNQGKNSGKQDHQLPSAGSIAARHNSHGGLSEILSENSLSLSGLNNGDQAHDLESDNSLDNGRRYLVQRWEGGTVCDMTGLPRRVEVQFHCNTQSTDRIALIREVGICDYVLVVHTPRLCGEPVFLASAGPGDSGADGHRKPAEIVCRPVAKDSPQQAPGFLDATVEPAVSKIAVSVLHTDEVEVHLVPEGQEAVAGSPTEIAAPIIDTQADIAPAQAEEKLASDTSAPEADTFEKEVDLVLDDEGSIVVIFDPQTGEVIHESKMDGLESGIEEVIDGLPSNAEAVPVDSGAGSGDSASRVQHEGSETTASRQSGDPLLALQKLEQLLQEKLDNLMDTLQAQQHQNQNAEGQQRQAKTERLADIMRLFGAKEKSRDERGDQVVKKQETTQHAIEKLLKHVTRPRRSVPLNPPNSDDDPKASKANRKDEITTEFYVGSSTHQQLKGLYAEDFDSSESDQAESKGRPKRDEL